MKNREYSRFLYWLVPACMFFLAETDSDRVKIQRSEIESYAWASFEQAKRMCGYQNDLRILESAQEAIKEHDCNFKRA